MKTCGPNGEAILANLTQCGGGYRTINVVGSLRYKTGLSVFFLCWRRDGVYCAVAVSTRGMARRTKTESPHLLIRGKNQKIFLGSDLARRYKSACVQAKSFPESSLEGKMVL